MISTYSTKKKMRSENVTEDRMRLVLLTVSIDHDSLTDHTVTIRDRDTMQQERVPVSELRRIIDEKTNFRNLLSKI
jgi:glycyl-tRNA synthetase (class II)